MKIHIGFIKEGSILHFPNSAYDYMKVCDRNGVGGVVNLSTGLYISTSELEEEGLSPMIDCPVENSFYYIWRRTSRRLFFIFYFLDEYRLNFIFFKFSHFNTLNH